MARVYNWQLNRDMAYWYPESRPKQQFAAVFDINKCIACQTCTLACKTTWTSGRGQEFMLWNNVESKPFGYYPLGWDVHILKKLGAQQWQGETYQGRTLFEAAPRGERVMGWLPDELDYAHPNVGEDDCAGLVQKGSAQSGIHHNWFFYLARICNHCTYPACLASCPRGSIYKRPEDGIVLLDQKRCRGYRECVKACPYKKVFFNSMTGTSEKCIACYPKQEQDLVPQCFLNCIGKIRLSGHLSLPEKANPENPVDYLVHIRKIALPLFPQFGLEPNVYYIPPVHVPLSFNEQLFGPRAKHAVSEYRKGKQDKDLAAVISLFGCTESIPHRWKRKGEMVFAFDHKGRELVRAPLTEPIFELPTYDQKWKAARTNIP